MIWTLFFLFSSITGELHNVPFTFSMNRYAVLEETLHTPPVMEHVVIIPTGFTAEELESFGMKLKHLPDIADYDIKPNFPDLPNYPVPDGVRACSCGGFFDYKRWNKCNPYCREYDSKAECHDYAMPPEYKTSTYLGCGNDDNTPKLCSSDSKDTWNVCPFQSKSCLERCDSSCFDYPRCSDPNRRAFTTHFAVHTTKDSKGRAKRQFCLTLVIWTNCHGPSVAGIQREMKDLQNEFGDVKKLVDLNHNAILSLTSSMQKIAAKQGKLNKEYNLDFHLLNLTVHDLHRYLGEEQIKNIIKDLVNGNFPIDVLGDSKQIYKLTKKLPGGVAGLFASQLITYGQLNGKLTLVATYNYVGKPNAVVYKVKPLLNQYPALCASVALPYNYIIESDQGYTTYRDDEPVGNFTSGSTVNNCLDKFTIELLNNKHTAGSRLRTITMNSHFDCPELLLSSYVSPGHHNQTHCPKRYFPLPGFVWYPSERRMTFSSADLISVEKEELPDYSLPPNVRPDLPHTFSPVEYKKKYKETSDQYQKDKEKAEKDAKNIHSTGFGIAIAAAIIIGLLVCCCGGVMICRKTYFLPENEMKIGIFFTFPWVVGGEGVKCESSEFETIVLYIVVVASLFTSINFLFTLYGWANKESWHVVTVYRNKKKEKHHVRLPARKSKPVIEDGTYLKINGVMTDIPQSKVLTISKHGILYVYSTAAAPNEAESHL